jgi:hypothetical protein
LSCQNNGAFLILLLLLLLLFLPDFFFCMHQRHLTYNSKYKNEWRYEGTFVENFHLFQQNFSVIFSSLLVISHFWFIFI